MWKRKDFKELADRFYHAREDFDTYSKAHPRKVITAMFIILFIAVMALLVSRLFNREGYAASIDKAFSEVNKNSDPKSQLGKGASPTDLLELYEMNGKMKNINPDSLTQKDSLILKEIETDLNNIIDEKD